jgi:hypothetical protein
MGDTNQEQIVIFISARKIGVMIGGRWPFISQHIIKHAVHLIIYMKYSNCRIRTLKKTRQIL